MTPAWLLDIVAALMLVVAAVSAALQLSVWAKLPVVAMLLISAPLVPVTVMAWAALGAPTVCGANDSVPGLASSVTAHETVELTAAVLLVGSGSTKVEELPKSAFAELVSVPPQAMLGSSVPLIV